MLKSSDYRKRTFSVAGATIGVLLIPQGLACATLAGVPPVYGLFTGFPAVIYALLWIFTTGK